MKIETQDNFDIHKKLRQKNHHGDIVTPLEIISLMLTMNL